VNQPDRLLLVVLIAAAIVAAWSFFYR